jgi:hypothetical protein
MNVPPTLSHNSGRLKKAEGGAGGSYHRRMIRRSGWAVRAAVGVLALDLLASAVLTSLWLRLRSYLGAGLQLAGTLLVFALLVRALATFDLSER